MDAGSKHDDQDLMSTALDTGNPALAWKRIKSNEGTQGIDV